MFLLPLLPLLLAVTWPRGSLASEYPERECCDPIYPLLGPTNRMMPTVPTTTGKSGSEKTVAILNCLYARKLCFEDHSCSAILEVIPRVCGIEQMACSTVTVAKCQAALRSLQTFEFFKPTCLCREPHVDRECNRFRDFLFDHPCIFVAKKDKESHGLQEALPTCNKALSVCQLNKSCVKLYDEFKVNCKTREGKCRMENRDACDEAWKQLRLSPMFGCICPDNAVKKRCDRIFSMVNYNPCVVNVISGVGDNATNLELIESQLENPLIDSEQQDLHSLRQLPIPSIHHHRLHHGPRNQSQHEPEPEHEQHPGGASGSGQPEPRLVLSSTCQHAYAACKSDAECKGLMQPVLSHCEQSSCARNECMSALQHFYRGASHKHSVEIAFCLCRKEEGRRNECMLAQERMHPVCAMRAAPPAETPSCSLLAEECRARAACRTRLEHYEQSCAVDSVTSKCAGQPQNCRAALLGILGTELRTSCTCRAHDAQGLYRCLGWQRLLWLNPCLVEAQREFHARRSRQHLQQRITTSSSTPATRLTPTPRAPLMAPTADDLEQEDKQLLENNAVGYATIEATEPTLQPSSSEGSPPTGTGAGASRGPLPTTATPTANTVATTTRPRTTAASGSSSSTTTTTAAAATTTTTTTTVTTSTTARPAPPTTPSSTTTSTPPPRFCVVQRPRQSHQYIREGKTRRLYREDEPECSELCKCGRNETLTCNTICIESSPCKTDFAFYNHAAPAYQAYRGRCLCYSGRFICMRPSPDAYNIPHGVFMFLGYSETDETLLKPHNNLSVVDAVSSLDSFMREELNNQTVCTLFLYNATRENVIAAARLLTDAGQLAANLSQAQSLQHLLRIKEECAAMLQELSEKINNRHQEVHSHPLLSIFKMAEVEIKLPRASGSAARTPLLPPALLLLLLLLLALASS
ncbi:uncharacterized protein LOC131666463 isoform X3 [Phymastichus coffea]|uniref:uncharacterized protein LOC131666463 isoform X3 n=1 Tax=Phymastichus coffea TaxID=108790 RepID=UPI00273BBD19|nr:uncharacterized protein LOC131666463 isoform X3 [Phymastichus coffea]